MARTRTDRAARSLLWPAALVAAGLASFGVGCGDDSAGDYGDGSGGGGVEGPAGPSGVGGAFGSTGTTVGTGSGPGASGTVGAGGGGFEDPTQPPPPVPPPPDPEEVTCDDLDPNKSLVLYLSADDSNSMASPAEAREALRNGGAPSAIRTYEFLNYYDVSFPAPVAPDVGLFAEAEPGDEAGTFDLMLAVRAPDAFVPRRPITMTLVVDTSGSMEGEPMDRSRASLRAIASQLAEGDIVNVLTWNTSNAAVLQGRQVTGPNDATLVGVINGLQAGGGTDLHGGLVAGYALAREHFGAQRMNRVVLISDGGANVGVTDADLIGQNADDADGEGIYLVGIGTGPEGGYSDALMDTVTDAGRGAYVYIDSADEAQRVLGGRFDETMEIAARAVRVEVTLPWYFQMKAFYGEEWSENPDEVDPQHLAPGDATVILQTLKACSADVVNLDDPVRLRATWQTPIERQDREAVLETTLGALLAGDRSHLAEAEAIVAYAEALKTGLQPELDAALAKVEALGDRQDPDLEEIAALLRLHPAMR